MNTAKLETGTWVVVCDGRKAIIAFTGSDTLRRWQQDARPVPVPVRVSCEPIAQARLRRSHRVQRRPRAG